MPTMTAMNTKDYIEIENKYGAKNYKPLDVVIEKASGVWVEDVDGKRYMDFLAAYSAVNQGHCHPRLIQRTQEQCARLALTSRAFRNNQLPMFAQKLCQMTGYEMMLPMNTGAEAVETALKMIRKWGHQVKGIEDNTAEIIVCDGNFHGRTISIVSFSQDPDAKDDYGPYTPGFTSIPYGDAEALEKAITPRTAGFIVEPIQGEGGVVIPQDGFLKKAREICTKNNVLMVCDEIQSGLGRTGKLFAHQWENIRPDALILGKALSGGMYPVSAVVADKAVMGVFKPGEHGSTYGGNPLASAIAVEALNIIEDEKLVERSQELGEYLMQQLEAINSPHVEKYRGRGLWVGVVLKESAGGARRFCEALKERGVLAKETHVNIIRLAPPLVITKEEIDHAIGILKEVLNMA